MPYEAALEIAKALRGVAKEAEEEAKAQGIIMDQALLLRTGVPVGLTSRRDMLKEAVREAQWNPVLRKALPGGIRSQEVFGRPVVTQHPPTRSENDA